MSDASLLAFRSLFSLRENKKRRQQKDFLRMSSPLGVFRDYLLFYFRTHPLERTWKTSWSSCLMHPFACKWHDDSHPPEDWLCSRRRRTELSSGKEWVQEKNEVLNGIPREYGFSRKREVPDSESNTEDFLRNAFSSLFIPVLPRERIELRKKRKRTSREGVREEEGNPQESPTELFVENEASSK